ncbi:hypothetical protein AMECASPLE_029374 [Ameca splendens]|uniref:Uncharacterized protein n=1 Tax=Ameca splendens TaxID=208324 RepID=A0ABV0YH74_9TELE
MHVQRRCVGENFATSFHGAEDIRPNFFSQLDDGGFDYFPALRHRLLEAFHTACRRVMPDICLGRRRGGHVSVLTVHSVSQSPPPFSLSLSPAGELNEHGAWWPSALTERRLGQSSLTTPVTSRPIQLLNFRFCKAGLSFISKNIFLNTKIMLKLKV